MRTCTPNNPHRWIALQRCGAPFAGSRGFTLIEMTVVIVLLGLISAVVLPNFNRWFGSTQQRVDGSRIAMQVQNLLARAAILNQSVLLNSKTAHEVLVDGKPALDLPVGWRVKDEDKLVVNGSGYCSPAVITFISADRQQVTIEVKEKQCDVTFTLRPAGV
jgi:prepilin-type N-terminal cleavage/methylation domain-containing protein